MITSSCRFTFCLNMFLLPTITESAVRQNYGRWSIVSWLPWQWTKTECHVVCTVLSGSDFIMYVWCNLISKIGSNFETLTQTQVQKRIIFWSWSACGLCYILCLWILSFTFPCFVFFFCLFDLVVSLSSSPLLAGLHALFCRSCAASLLYSVYADFLSLFHTWLLFLSFTVTCYWFVMTFLCVQYTNTAWFTCAPHHCLFTHYFLLSQSPCSVILDLCYGALGFDLLVRNKNIFSSYFNYKSKISFSFDSHK